MNVEPGTSAYLILLLSSFHISHMICVITVGVLDCGSRAVGWSPAGGHMLCSMMPLSTRGLVFFIQDACD